MIRYLKLTDLLMWKNSNPAAMPSYTCETCGKVFPQRSRYDTHRGRKTPCGPAPALPAPALPAPALPAPLLKWVGGKSQIRDKVLEHFPSQMENYYEPFLGGGSILLGLLHKQRQGEITVRGEIHASDANPHLIGFYKNVQSQPDELLHHARELLANCPQYESKAPKGVNRHPTTAEEAKECTETYYYWIRTQFNSLPKDQQQTPFASALFLFLNKTCFRGVYREGPNGFNVPFGNYKNPTIIEEEHLREVSEMIQPVLFHTRSFTDPSLSPTRGDFVYVDPPYAPEKDTSFVGYTSNGFDLEAHEKFFEWCNQQKEGGVRLLISNADVPLVQNAFHTSDWIIQTVVCRRAIHSKTPNATTQEVLITSVPS